MTRVPGLILLSVLATVALPAQTSSRTGKPTTPTSSEDSDHEQNIQAYVALLRSDVVKQKSRLVGLMMNLDSEGSANFWPIYRDFEAELTRFYDAVGAAIKDYAGHFGTLTDESADKLATRVLDLEQERNDLKRKYYQKFKAALNPLVAMKFLQVENQIERVMDLQIASALPIAERGKP
jgi:hypothetical protein